MCTKINVIFHQICSCR